MTVQRPPEPRQVQTDADVDAHVRAEAARSLRRADWIAEIQRVYPNRDLSETAVLITKSDEYLQVRADLATDPKFGSTPPYEHRRHGGGGSIIHKDKLEVDRSTTYRADATTPPASPIQPELDATKKARADALAAVLAMGQPAHVDADAAAVAADSATKAADLDRMKTYRANRSHLRQQGGAQSQTAQDARDIALSAILEPSKGI